MSKKHILKLAVVCAVSASAGCALIVAVPDPTMVEAENNLNSMSVDVSGITTDVNGIDLEDVVIGDVLFSLIPYGATTVAKNTNRSGDVTVAIGTAVVFTQVLNQTVSISFSNISPMETTITPNVVNTVVFNQTTAGVIFQALAKKKAPTAI